MRADRDLTPERLREALAYDAETGVFIWRKPSSNCVRAGEVAGTRDRFGYVVIQLDKVIRRAHRLAWLYVHGTWPNGEIDHRFGVRDDNRISELREATRLLNTQNRRSLGVRKHAGGKYEPRITVEGRALYLGLFDTLEAAQAARTAAKKRFHPFNML